jgi:hypothetical protein
MCYSRRYNTQIPEIKQRLRELLMVKHLSGQIENEFDGNLHAPTGWAILKVESVDPKLNGELDSFISTLEKMNQPDQGEGSKSANRVLHSQTQW